MEKVAVLAITKNGIEIGRRIKAGFAGWSLHVPEKFRDAGGKNPGSGDDPDISWFGGPATKKMEELFGSNDGLVCLFSLGAVIRMISPHLRDKKTDPAIVVIDDGANFVISALSGHLGGANLLAQEIAARLGSTPVITTAADVNGTIAVDLVGRRFGWTIEDGGTVTATSAHMVNGERIGVFQNAGEMGWRPKEGLPKNVTVFDSLERMAGSDSKAFLVISDQAVDPGILAKSVVYRPRSLVVGVGLHRDTSKKTIRDGIDTTFGRFGLSTKSIERLVSIEKPDGAQAAALAELGREMGVPVQYIGRGELAGVEAPNPSETVRAFEGTPSVSEAAAILASGAGGRLVVEKQKFPPDLTVAVARKGQKEGEGAE